MWLICFSQNYLHEKIIKEWHAVKRIYLDNAATTPVHPEVVQTISDALANLFGNASSTYQRGRDSRRELDQARSTFARSINAKPEDIVITSGGSESNNMALIKAAEKMKDQGSHIITTAVEHQAVLKPMQYLESIGYEVTYLPVNDQGLVEVSTFKEALRDDTILVSIMFANNEMGARMPVEEIGQILSDHQAFYHVDAVQAYGKIKFDIQDLQADLLSVSGHKINGPKGIGFLYMDSQNPLQSFIRGGNQENKHRAGTENLPYIMGFAKAVDLRFENLKDYQDQIKALKERFIQNLEDGDIEFSINGSLESSFDHILSVYFPGAESDKLLIQLDLKGVEAAAGSACTAGTLQPSHVLTAIYGEGAPEVAQTLRFSFGQNLTFDDIDQATEIIIQAVQSLTN